MLKLILKQFKMNILFNTKDVVENNNPGIAQELAIFFIFSEKGDQNELINCIKKREDYNFILNIIEKIKSNNNSIVEDFLSNNNIESIENIELTTQNDKVGPSDIVINEIIGISVKYNNNCNFNPTGRLFLLNDDVSFIKEKLNSFTYNYITEMNTKYGSSENWFRNRNIKSEEVKKILNLIKDIVVSNWNLEKLDKGKIIKRIYHLDSPINYIILNISSKYDLKYTFQLNEFDPNQVTLENDINTQYIYFKHKNEYIGKMQVKFNNGALEKSKGKKIIKLDNYNIKIGTPISSWNFNLI